MGTSMEGIGVSPSCGGCGEHSVHGALGCLTLRMSMGTCGNDMHAGCSAILEGAGGGHPYSGTLGCICGILLPGSLYDYLCGGGRCGPPSAVG